MHGKKIVLDPEHFAQRKERRSLHRTIQLAVREHRVDEGLFEETKQSVDVHVLDVDRLCSGQFGVTFADVGQVFEEGVVPDGLS